MPFTLFTVYANVSGGVPPVVVLVNATSCPASMAKDEGVSDVINGYALIVTETGFEGEAYVGTLLSETTAQ